MCSRLRKPLAAVEEQHKAWLEVARLCADDEQTWALEVSSLSRTFTILCSEYHVQSLCMHPAAVAAAALQHRLRAELCAAEPARCAAPRFATAGALACDILACAEAGMSCR